MELNKLIFKVSFSLIKNISITYCTEKLLHINFFKRYVDFLPILVNRVESILQKFENICQSKHLKSGNLWGCRCMN